MDRAGFLDQRLNALPVPRPRVDLAEERHMSWQGWTMIGLLVAGVTGGLILWTMHGSKGGHDT